MTSNEDDNTMFDKTRNEDELDAQIKAALQSESHTPFTGQVATIIEEVSQTFSGQHRFLLLWSVGKMVGAVLVLFFSIYQFFHQESMMGLVAYASLAIICVIAAATIFLTIWISIQNNNRQRDIKRLELQVALLSDRLLHQTKGEANHG